MQTADRLTLDPLKRPVVSALEAFRILGVDRTTGYKAIREGTFPVPVLHVGRMIRVPTIALVRLLEGVPHSSSETEGE